MKKRWEFFSEDELRCKGTGELNMDEGFMAKLIALRKELDQHIKKLYYISSAHQTTPD